MRWGGPFGIFQEILGDLVVDVKASQKVKM